MNKLLLLVDGSSYLYRAYHALPDLRNSAGEPTGAIYGFLNMLRRLQKDYPTAYRACIFDAKGKTFRNDLYQEYKANRAAMPDDLVEQTGRILELVDMLGWPVLQVEGVEADDIIGTLTVKAHEDGFDTIVSTGDKDMSQLVDDKVTLVNTMNNEVLDREGVIKKFGVPPERIVDYLSLIGDTSDNVPGVAKVGPKTAVKWLTQYQSLDGVIENAQNITGAVGENLRQSLDWLPQAHELVRIRTNCDLPEKFVSIETSLVKKPENTEGLKKAFERFGFKSWAKELNAARQETPKTAGQIALFDEPEEKKSGFVSDKEYETVLTEKQIEKWLENIDQSELTAIDTETTSLDVMDAKLVGISLSVKPGHAAYIPLAHHSMEQNDQLPLQFVLDKMKPWLENPKKPKVGQNLKYDSHVLANYGIRLEGIVHDTLLESYVLESHRRHDMDSLSERFLDYKPVSYTDICGKGVSQIGFDEIAIDVATNYAAEDADVTLQLHQFMWPRLKENDGLRFIYEKIEIPTSIVLQKMERNGVLIDVEKLNTQSRELGVKMDELQESAFDAAGQSFNLNSPKQLGELLFDKLKLPMIRKTPSGAPSTSEEVLEKLAENFPLPKIILDYRGMSKLKTTYTDKLPRMVNPETGRVHTNYAQAVAVTGRLASNDPNLQNIPIRSEEGRRIREAFIASPGNKIISADYSQIELRIMAHLSGDASLLKAFHDGQDVHRVTASEIFDITPLEVTSDQRRYAKVINFGLIYGMSAFGVASNLGISRMDAKNYIDRYFERYPGVARYMDETRQLAREQGYVETVFGRRLWLPEINSPNGPRRQAAERAAINAPMQGTAADIIKLSMIAVQNWLEKEKLDSKLIMQVHDELVLDVPEKELAIVREKLPELMAQVARLKVPLIAEVGVGDNWDQAH